MLARSFRRVASCVVVGSWGAAAQLAYSTLDGSGNNVDNPGLGAAGDIYTRPAQVSYEDGVGSLAAGLPSPRLVSLRLGRQVLTQSSSSKTVAMLAWGQSVAHDVGDMHGNSSDSAPISVPNCDYRFDPACSGAESLPFSRGKYDGAASGPRQMLNFASSFIDASWLYGGDYVRENTGGRLLMPNNVFPDYGDESAVEWSGAEVNYTRCRLPRVADGRAIENPGLLNNYVLFGREHNRIAAELAAANPNWDDENLFQEARMRNIALVQKITLEEYGPMLLGTSLKDAADSYDASVDPRISLLFATAAYRYGHSAIPGMYNVGNDVILLRDIQMSRCVTMLDSDLVIEGLTTTPINGVDTDFIADVRDHLRTSPDKSLTLGSADLFSINIQRGRDAGLPFYNDARESLGLSRVTTFGEMVAGSNIDASVLEDLYGDVDKVDFYVGGLLERKEADTRGSGSSEVGETFAAVMRDQFRRLRLGDRFWYEWTPELAAFVEGRSMQQVMKDNVPNFDAPSAPFAMPTEPCLTV